MRGHRIEAGGLGVDRDEPRSRARATQALSRSSERTVSYLLRSICRPSPRLRAASAAGRQVAVAAVRRTHGSGCAAGRRVKRRGRPAGTCTAVGAGCWRLRDRRETAGIASTSLASMPDFSATRRVSVVNSIALRKAIRACSPARAPRGPSTGHVELARSGRASPAAWRCRAFSALSISVSRRLSCLISRRAPAAFRGRRTR